MGLTSMTAEIKVWIDPVLFTGTMRKNLDPFRQHTDEDLWNALQEVQMKAVVEELPNKLDKAYRTYLSADEPLFFVETDSLIQQTIRDKFQECTVVTTAHGLNTIIDCDRILVLDARIQGYDEPYVLLHDHRGLSYQMVQQTSQAEAASPLCTAKQAGGQGPGRHCT
ncbi:Multidrug resistance-associated protein 4 [Channa argus]|uniref:Multidrug resistance-associated protein 4 n=1 Tax=Channa argus TaxID=215402 RepID=A0A6G1PX39_CHAAH|nr:Multidrug resistance-associated protein 4 [Channa argus]